MAIPAAPYKHGHHTPGTGHHRRHHIAASAAATSAAVTQHVTFSTVQNNKAAAATTASAGASSTEATAKQSAATAPPAAPSSAAAAVAARKRGHHSHGGHHRRPVAPPASYNSTIVVDPHPGMGVVSHISTYPPGKVIGAPQAYHPPPPLANTNSGGGLSGGAIFGIILCILAVFGVVGFVVFRLWRKKQHRDPFIFSSGQRSGYWGHREHRAIVAPPPDDDITSFDQDFKHWVEVVGSTSGKPFQAPTMVSNPNRTLNRIPSGVEPLGTTENGTLVFQDPPSQIRVPRSTGQSTMVNEPVSPLKAPPGFGNMPEPLGLAPPQSGRDGVQAPPFRSAPGGR